jgi:hypothetical protein
MKKLIAISSAIMAFSLLMVPVAFAAPDPCIATGTCTIPDPQMTTLAAVMAFLSRIAGWIFVVLLFMAFLFILLGGFTYVTSKGDPKAITTAKNYIIYALIGVAVGVLAKGLVYVVCNMLGTTCPNIF